MNFADELESLPESEEIIRKQALEKIKKALYKIHLNSRYGVGGTYMILSAQTQKIIHNIQKTNIENER